MDKMKFGFELETIVGIKKEEFNVFRDLNTENLIKTIQRIVQKRKEDKAKILKIIRPYIESRLGDESIESENEVAMVRIGEGFRGREVGEDFGGREVGEGFGGREVGKVFGKGDLKDTKVDDKEMKIMKENVKDMVNRVLSSEIDKLPRSAIEKEVHNCFEMFENDFVYTIDSPLDGKHLQLIKSSFVVASKTIFEEFKTNYGEYKKNKRKISKYIGLFNQQNIDTLFKNGTTYEFALFRDYIETSNDDVADALRSFVRSKEVELITDLLNEDDPKLFILMITEWQYIDKKFIDYEVKKKINSPWNIIDRLTLATILNNYATSGTVFRIQTEDGTCVPPSTLGTQMGARIGTGTGTGIGIGKKTNRVTRSVFESSIWTVVDDGSVYHKLIGEENQESSLIPTYKSDYNKIIPASKIKSVLLDWVEIVSPIISWDDLFVQKKFERALLFGSDARYGQDENIKVPPIDMYNNVKTSNHVHISMKNELKNPDKLLKVCAAWLYFEPLFYSMVAPFRSNNYYCKPVFKQMHDIKGLKDKEREKEKDKEKYKNQAIDRVKTFFYSMKGVDEYNKNGKESTKNKEEVKKRIKGIQQFFGSEKYSVFNLVKVSTIGSIEVRLKHGSNDSEENSMWMRLLAYFVMASVKNQKITDITPLPIKDIAWKLQSVTHGSATMGKKETIICYHSMSEYLKTFILRGMQSITNRDKVIGDDVNYVIDHWLGLINPMRSKDVSKWKRIVVSIDWTR